MKALSMLAAMCIVATNAQPLIVDGVFLGWSHVINKVIASLIAYFLISNSLSEE